MGYLISGHLLESEPGKDSLRSLPDSIGWRVYKDPDTEVLCLDTFPSRDTDPWPLSQLPPTTELQLEMPSELLVLEEAYAALKSIGLANSFKRAQINLSLLISSFLKQRVCTFSADDDELDFACISDCGKLDLLKCTCGDLEFRYSSEEIVFEPLVVEEDPEVHSDLEKLRESLTSIELLSRSNAYNSQLHNQALGVIATYCGKPCSPFGIGTFDMMDPEPILVMPKPKTPTDPPSQARDKVARHKSWWQFWK